jgi:hypothetical protein
VGGPVDGGGDPDALPTWVIDVFRVVVLLVSALGIYLYVTGQVS